MREQEKKFKALAKELKELKNKLFGGAMFVILDEQHKDTKRYNQLSAFFMSQYRTTNWTNPLN